MIRAFLFLMLLAQLAPGCCSVSKQPGQPLEDPVLSQGLRQNLERLYPHSFQVSHRCILEAAGRQFVLEGYLRVNEPESFRLLAKGDMGGTVFELQQVKGEQPEVVKNPVSLRPSWLLEGAARDISVLYFRSPQPQSRLVRYQTGDIGLAQEVKPGLWEEFHFQPETGRLLAYMLIQGGEPFYRADFGYFEALSPGGREVPRTITIVDHRMHYRLTVRVLEIGEITGNP
ncbi:MAG: hypothetical protein L6277_05715 [Desulfobacterales bacterium]|nr:hypothetical protein [Desulfobacterales bacterium]